MGLPERGNIQKDVANWYEQVLEEFESEWLRERIPSITAFLQAATEKPPHDVRSLWTELVKVDLEFRWRQLAAQRSQETEIGSTDTRGSHPTILSLDDYRQHIASLVDQTPLPVELIAEEYRVRHRWGDMPAIDSYVAKYPEQATDIRRALLEIKRELSDEANSGESSPVLKSDPLPASIGRYRVIGKLDAGGQATVYRVVHPTLAKELVLKLSRKRIAPGDVHRDRLINEGRLLADLDHPALARVYDIDFDQERPFIVMEYVRGRSLRQFIGKRSLPADRACSIVSKVSRGVGVIHRHGVIHQDIKPANIVMTESDEPRLIDFGLARITDAWQEDTSQSGSISGTAPYMPPEQATGNTDQVSERSDIFALGALLFRLLTGSPLYPADTVEEAIHKASRVDFDQALLDDTSPRLRAVCLRALQKAPQDRFSTADELADALDALEPRRRRWTTMVSVAAVISLVTILSVSALQGYRPIPAAAARSVVDVSTHRDGVDLRRDFDLILTQPKNAKLRDGVYHFRDGDKLALRAQVDQDCYIGIWLLEPDGTETQLFPDPSKPHDHYRKAGEHMLPVLELYPSAANEDILVAASTRFWPAQAGADHGHRVVLLDAETLATYGTPMRGARLAEAATAEARLPFFVSSQRRTEINTDLQESK